MGVGTGVAAGLLVSTTASHNGVVSPEKALSIAKSAFKKHGPIQGSWIQIKNNLIKGNFLNMKSISEESLEPWITG